MTPPTTADRTIFLEVIEYVPQDRWDAFLRERCAGDPQQFDRVQRLLEAHCQLGEVRERSPAMSCETITALPTNAQIGPYQLRERIGEGGMGIVYEAEQTEPVRRTVALKVIKPGMATEDVVARFQAERQALAMMDHPSIARVFDGGVTDGDQSYFMMELVKGIPFTEYCDEQRLDTRDRLELFLKVCRAVHHAHQKGVIHRDLKPSNILVAEIDGMPVPKVIDFGIAKAIDQKLTDRTVYTRFTQMVGTPLYMSPEQVGRGTLDIDIRSDVYSLGVVLYELLTGSTPFNGATIKQADEEELRRIFREDQPRRPSTMISTLGAEASSTIAERRRSEPGKLASTLRGELDWLVLKALEKDRARRYESAGAMAEDVERYLVDDPVLARPPSTAYRISKFIRRNRALVVSVATMFVALGLGFTLAMVGFLTANKRLTEVIEEQENNEILIKVLGDSYGFPWGRHMYGEDQTMHDSLEAFSAQLDTRFQDRPNLEIRFRLVLAFAHYNRGEHTTAREHLQEALDLAEREYGPTHEVVADILTDLAHDVQRHRENNSLAEDLLIQPFDPRKGQEDAQRAVDIYEELDLRTLGKGHALFCMAWYMQPNVTRHTEAETYLREALEIARSQRPDEDSYRQIYAMWDVVEHLTWQRAGGMDEARSLTSEAVAMSRRLLGEKHPVTAGLIGERGELSRFLGDEQEALRSYHEAWKTLTEITPPNNSLPHSYGLTLAEVYFVADRHQEGLQILDEVEMDCRDRELDSYVRCHYLRGWAHMLREDYAAAELSLHKAVKLADEHLDENHAYVLLSRFHRARSLDTLERKAEAQEQYQRLLTLTRRRVRLPNARQMELFVHAWALLRSGSTDELMLNDAFDAAEQGLKRAAVWTEYGSGPHLHLAKAIAQYKLAKMAQQDVGRAITTLREGLDQHEFIPLRSRHKHVPMSRHELEVQLAQWLVEQGQERQAVQVLNDAVELRIEHFPDDHPKVALARLRLGSLLVGLGEFDRAEGVLRTAYEELSTSPQAADFHRERAGTLMADLLRNEGRYKEMAESQARAETHRRPSKSDGTD